MGIDLTHGRKQAKGLCHPERSCIVYFKISISGGKDAVKMRGAIESGFPQG